MVDRSGTVKLNQEIRVFVTTWVAGEVLRFDVPALGVYLFKVGDALARRVAGIR